MQSSDNRFLDAIIGRMERDPARVFAEVWAGDRRQTMTWGDLGQRSRAFAAAYTAAGLEPGDIVFIILRHGPDLYPSYLGAMLAECVPSFLPFPNIKQDVDLYWSSHLAVFERTHAKLLVTYGELIDAVRRKTSGALHLLDVASVTNNAVGSDRLVDEGAVALLQHSSGTTGLKKGVALTFRSIRLQIEAYADRLALDQDESVIASWLPLYHDMGLIACFMLPLYLGVKIVSLDAFEWTVKPALLLEAVEAHRATHVWLPNFAFAHIARATPKALRFDLSSIEAFIGCSEPNRPEVFNLFQQRFADDGVGETQIQTCYAMAETVFAIAQSDSRTPLRRLRVKIVDGRVSECADNSMPTYLSNGRTLDGIEVRILCEGVLRGSGFAGEICVRAPFLFEGYFADEGATRAAFVDGWFKTGDLGFIQGDEIYVFGRVKELIIINGRNVFANDIEACAMQVQGVKQGRCVAFGLYFPSFGAEQIVIVAEHDGVGAQAKETIRAISNALNAQIGTSPADIRIVEPGWLVKTTSGKLSRSENIRKYMQAFQPDLAPSSVLEAAH